MHTTLEYSFPASSIEGLGGGGGNRGHSGPVLPADTDPHVRRLTLCGEGRGWGEGDRCLLGGSIRQGRVVAIRYDMVSWNVSVEEECMYTEPRALDLSESLSVDEIV